MCEPTTLLIAATAMSAVGSIAGGVAAKNQANTNAKISLGNAQIANRNKLLTKRAGAVAVSRIARKGQQSAGAIRAAAAKSGVEVDADTPLDVQVQDVINGYVNAATEGYNYDRKAEGFEVQAWNFQSQAAAYKTQGKNAMLAGVLNAATSVAAGAFVGSHNLGWFAKTPTASLPAVIGPTGVVPGRGAIGLAGMPL
jgi:hypothetical protein